MAGRGRGAARPWAAPACRRANWCAPRFAPAPRRMAGRAASMPDRETAAGELHGGFPVAPLPKAALVTGGARRIGRALVLALAASGYAVAIHYQRSGAAATALADEIVRKGGKAVPLAADLADEAAIKHLLPAAKAVLGPIGVLV